VLVIAAAPQPLDLGTVLLLADGRVARRGFATRRNSSNRSAIRSSAARRFAV
jgi:hypothetical protein